MDLRDVLIKFAESYNDERYSPEESVDGFLQEFGPELDQIISLYRASWIATEKNDKLVPLSMFRTFLKGGK